MYLTEDQKRIGRRNFMKAAAVLPVAGAFAYTAGRNIGAVKTGIVGTGMEGRILIEVANPQYLYLNAMCDIRPDNQILGEKKIIDSGHSPKPQVYTNYEDMLSDADIEAVLIATPLKMHGPMAIQALEAGKHVFTEKTMAFSVQECEEMINLANKKGLNLQVGHQRFYNPLYWDAYRMYTEGLLGNVYHVRALWHRNTDWNYWIHVTDEELKNQLLSFDPSKYGYQDIQHLVNWRWYEETSHGLWTEPCSHQMAITNWLFMIPLPLLCVPMAECSRSEDYITKVGYEQNDRTISDHIYAIYEYEDGRIVTYSSQQSNTFDQYYEQIMGTFGTIILAGENQYYLFWEPGWDEEKAKDAVERHRNPTQVEVVKEDKASESAFAAHVSAEAQAAGGPGTTMSPLDPYKWELEGFAHTIRIGAPNLCNGVRAAKAAQACFAGQQALLTKERVVIEPLKVNIV